MSKTLNINEFSEHLNNIAPHVKEELTKTIELCCQKVRSDIQESMAKTERNMDKSYYTHNKTTPHHPSLPGNPPAPDTGNLRNSIRYEIHAESRSPYGVVGTTQNDPPYGQYLEYGTSKVAPRPWLRPVMEKNNEWIRQSIAKAVGRGLKGGSEK